MTSSDNEPELDADDATLAASDDVVAQIRAHAAKVRRGEIDPDEELQVWTESSAPSQASSPDTRASDSADPSMFKEVVLDVRDDADAIGNSPGQVLVGDADGLLLPNDETVAIPPVVAASAAGVAGPLADADYTEPPVTKLMQPPSPATPSSQPVQGSLIDGLQPPHGSATFWTSDKTHGAGSIDFGPRHRAGGGLPTWAWIVLVAVVIILASVGIAVAIAVSSTGTVT